MRQTIARIAGFCLPFAAAAGSIAGICEAGDNVWTSNGPAGGTVLSLSFDPADPRVAYAGTERGLILGSDDRGFSWTIVTTLSTDAPVRALVVDPSNPQTVYAGTGRGVLKSEDGGASWRMANIGLMQRRIRSLVIDPYSPQVVYAGIAGRSASGLYMSTRMAGPRGQRSTRG